jgi:hypothetical protein
MPLKRPKKTTTLKIPNHNREIITPTHQIATIGGNNNRVNVFQITQLGKELNSVIRTKGRENCQGKGSNEEIE